MDGVRLISRERLAELGYGKISRSILAKIERGNRRVDIDDVLALAAALDVAPVHLFVPYDRDRMIEITPSVQVPAHLVRRWVHGWSPLPGGNVSSTSQNYPERTGGCSATHRYEILALSSNASPSLRCRPSVSRTLKTSTTVWLASVERLMRSVTHDITELTRKPD